LGCELLALIFEGDNFESAMTDALGPLGMIARTAKPMIERRAITSLQNMTEENAAWLIDRIHRLSWQFENVTGNFSGYHYDENELDDE
jgi:hypothetical protein